MVRVRERERVSEGEHDCKGGEGVDVGEIEGVGKSWYFLRLDIVLLRELEVALCLQLLSQVEVGLCQEVLAVGGHQADHVVVAPVYLGSASGVGVGWGKGWG